MSTRINLNGIHEMDVTLAGPTSAAITAPGVVTLTETISGAANQVFATPNGSAGPASLRTLTAADLPPYTTNAFAVFGPQTVATAGSVFVTLLSWPIYAGQVPAGRGFEFHFTTQQTNGIGGTNQFRVLWGNSAVNTWPAYGNGAATSWGSVAIYNITGTTGTQGFVCRPLTVVEGSAAVVVPGVISTASENTTVTLPFSLQWSGPAGATAQVVQASLVVV